MIPFNRPCRTGVELEHVSAALGQPRLCGDGPFSRRCEEWFEAGLPTPRALLTSSCTHALELAAMLTGVMPGDEVIMPSYTFVSTANAFALRGARVVFVDVSPDTMNLDPVQLEAAVTSRTRVIVPVHYAGVSCDMSAIMDIALRHDILVVEDAAQGVGSSYEGQNLGSIGHLAAFSFHETKNLTSGGEGGLLVVNDDRFQARAEILREKGTNRSAYFRGAVDKYTWVDIGSSYLLSELQAAYLWGQLERMLQINADRLDTWNYYLAGFKALADRGAVELPHVPASCTHNGHIFYLKVRDLQERTSVLEHLERSGVQAAFHYVPLHSSPAGSRFGRFHGCDRFTTRESERLLRLPLWFGMRDPERETVVEAVYRFFS